MVFALPKKTKPLRLTVASLPLSISSAACRDAAQQGHGGAGMVSMVQR